MANVLERIKLYYGSTSQMEVRPREPSGTVILLTLPIRKQDRLGAG
jgi:sensor histidine kinase YesM